LRLKEKNGSEEQRHHLNTVAKSIVYAPSKYFFIGKGKRLLLPAVKAL
jgi:hypothetical protein